jgi:hypothetical protein
MRCSAPVKVQQPRWFVTRRQLGELSLFSKKFIELCESGMVMVRSKCEAAGQRLNPTLPGHSLQIPSPLHAGLLLLKCSKYSNPVENGGVWPLIPERLIDAPDYWCWVVAPLCLSESMPTHTSTRIPRAERNAAGEDIPRAGVSSRQRWPESNTSSKAIVLRHGRHRVWGEGQIATFKKLSGQEKLALKAGL